MNKLFTLFFTLASIFSFGQNVNPPNYLFAESSMQPCPFDSTQMLLQADDWLIYQTLDDTWAGTMDSTQCIGVKNISGTMVIELSQIDISKPVFVKSLMNDSTKVPMLANTIYEGSAAMETSDDTFVNFSPNCANGFCTGVIFGIEIPDSTGTSTNIRTYSDIAQDGTDLNYYDYCIVTENFPDKVFLKEVIYKFKLLNSSAANLWFRPSYSNLTGHDYGISLIAQDTTVDGFNLLDSTYNIYLNEISTTSSFYSDNFILVYHDSTYPSPEYLSYLDLAPFDNDTFQSTINLFVDFFQVLHPQPFVQFRGGLVEGSDSIRHHFNLINNDGGLCFGYGLIEFTFSDGNNYIHNGGDIFFGGPSACFQFKNNSALIVGDETYLEYGKNGMGMLVLATGGTIKIGKNSTLFVNNTMALYEQPQFYGVVDNQQIYMELNKGSNLVFGEKAKLTNKFSIDKNMKLNIYMNGGILDDSKLSPEERAVINLIYPTPPEFFKENVKVFPNPTSDFLIFSMILENENSVEIEAYDLAGRFVFSQTKNGQKGNNDFQIQVNDLSEGVYFFRIKTDLGEAIEKVMVFN